MRCLNQAAFGLPQTYRQSDGHGFTQIWYMYIKPPQHKTYRYPPTFTDAYKEIINTTHTHIHTEKHTPVFLSGYIFKKYTETMI